MFEKMLGAFLAPYGSDFCVLRGSGGVEESICSRSGVGGM